MPRPRKEPGDKSRFAKRLDQLIGNGSIVEFAEKCGVKEYTIRRLRQGSGKKAGREILNSIATTTGCNLEWLLNGIGDPYSKPDTPDPRDNPSAAYEEASCLLAELHGRVVKAHPHRRQDWARALFLLASRFEKCLQDTESAPDNLNKPA